MLKNTNTSSTKHRSWPFWVIIFAFMALVFCFGLFFVSPDSQVTIDTLSGIGSHLLKVLVKFISVIVLTLVLGSLYFKFILGIPLSNLRAKLREDHNDSHAWIIGGIAVSLTIVFFMAGGVNLRQYIFQLCTKAVAGYFIAIIATLILTRLAGVKSIEEYRHWIDRPNNDSYAILVCIILIASLLLAMS